MKKGLFRGLMLLLIMIVLPVNAKAAIKFSVSKSADNLKPGSSVSVNVKASGASSSDTHRLLFLCLR